LSRGSFAKSAQELLAKQAGGHTTFATIPSLRPNFRLCRPDAVSSLMFGDTASGLDQAK
jgi:hypothetical protein